MHLLFFSSVVVVGPFITINLSIKLVHHQSFHFHPFAFVLMLYFHILYSTDALKTRAANSVNFYIEFKFEFEFSLFYKFEFMFEFNIFIFSSSSLSSAKIYQVFSSSENKVVDLRLSTFAIKLNVQTYVQTSVIISKCRCHKPGNMCIVNLQ